MLRSSINAPAATKHLIFLTKAQKRLAWAQSYQNIQRHLYGINVDTNAEENHDCVGESVSYSQEEYLGIVI